MSRTKGVGCIIVLVAQQREEVVAPMVEIAMENDSIRFKKGYGTDGGM